MWIDKSAEKSFNLTYLFEEFLDSEAYNNIKIKGKEKIGDIEVYKVTATQYLKNIERTFYFGDFSVMVDIMDNSYYVRKHNDIMKDYKWAIILFSKLSKNDEIEYKKQFKQYHSNRIKNECDILKNL